MKSQVRQIRDELKYMKKGTKSIIEYVIWVKAIENLVLAVGDLISEQDQIDSIFGWFIIAI